MDEIDILLNAMQGHLDRLRFAYKTIKNDGESAECEILNLSENLRVCAMRIDEKLCSKLE